MSSVVILCPATRSSTESKSMWRSLVFALFGMLSRARAGRPALGQLKNLTTGIDQPLPCYSLLQDLRRNPELSEEDAANELRWITQAAGSSGQVIRSQSGLGGVIQAMVKQRGDGVPLQYVIGDTDFGPLTLLCQPPTLIPRPETAHCFSRLAKLILDESASDIPLNVVDLCTGSAPIPLLLRHELGPRVGQLLGVDISPLALALANKNVDFTGLTGITLWQESVFAVDFGQKLLAKLGKDRGGNPRKVSLITANPPYIPLDQYRRLPRSVRYYEDENALLSGKEDPLGLVFYKQIAKLLLEVLDYDMTGPRVAVEVGEGQAGKVRELFQQQGLVRTEAWLDQWGVERLVVGWTR